MRRLLLILSILILANQLTSQPANCTEYAGAYMELGAGARAAALGKAQTALSDDAYASYWNPAGLMGVSKMDINASYTSFFGIVNKKTFNYAHVYEKGVLAFSYISSWVDGIKNTSYTENRPLPIDDFSYNASALIISRASDISKMVPSKGVKTFWGMSLKLMGEGFSDDRPGASGIGLDVGLQQHYTGNSFSWGINFQNIVKTLYEWDTPSKNAESLATAIRIGIGYQLLPQWNYSLDLNFKDSRPFSYHTGVEYSVLNKNKAGVSYFLRGGIDNSNGTLGLGLKYAGYKLDYAYRCTRYDHLDSTHLISIGFGN
ncbi:MAG: PorV/PorQ family protein [Candidatus Margulisiibacteriota bacterium]